MSKAAKEGMQQPVFQNSFGMLVTSLWNILPKSVVTASLVNCFKGVQIDFGRIAGTQLTQMYLQPDQSTGHFWANSKTDDDEKTFLSPSFFVVNTQKARMFFTKMKG